MTDAYIAGIAMTALGKFPEKSVKQLTREAVDGALKDAGCAMGDVNAAWFSNTRQALLEGQNTIRGQCALRSMGFEGIPIANVENACASGSTALIQALAHIKAGFCDVALVVGAEKMWFPEQREAMFKAFLGGTDVHDIDATKARLAHIGDGVMPAEYAQKPGGLHSFFMDIYAAMARFHMKSFGTTMRQFAVAASKNHFHSTLNPLSQYREDMSVDQVLADPVISWPLTRAMCAPLSDGGAAAVIVSDRVLAKKFDAKRAIKIMGAALVSGINRKPEDLGQHIGRRAALAAYEMAGVGPKDIDVAEVHDASAYAEIQQIENLGFCKMGEGGPFTDSGATRLGGSIPINTSGGLVSKGHPIGATGIIQLHELVTQLRGEAGSRQVEGARIAAAENGGGFFQVEEAATVVTVLGRA
ncbi:MAG: thiolase family protein [Alphaproteobacteria bacterium]